MIFNQRQIVIPTNHIRYTNEYLYANRVYLLHVINSDTGKCYCGRDANGWDMPYRDEARGVLPTIEDILNGNEFCGQCVRVLKGCYND